MEDRIETNDLECHWVLPAMRELMSRHPSLQDQGADELATRLGAPVEEVEAALESLTVEGEVLA